MDYKDVINEVVSGINSRNCMLHVYVNCTGLGVRSFISYCLLKALLLLMWKKNTCNCN